MKEANSRHTRQRVAHQAARMMAEEGIVDYGHAKRKAARQLGVPEDGHLPTNAEIDQAIREHHEIFHGETHQQHLKALRNKAIHIMQLFERFEPHLVGAVLDGTAGRFARTEIQLFADDLKEVELFCLNARIPYRLEEKTYRIGGEKRVLPAFMMETEIGPVQLTVFTLNEMRALPRKSRHGDLPERASLPSLIELVANT